MPGGRPAKPAEQHRKTGRSVTRKANGTPIAEAVVVLQMELDVPPVPIALGPTGRAAWERLWTAGREWLSLSTDLDVLIRLCEAHDERTALKQVLAEDGHFVKGQRGGLVSHPAVAQLRVLEKQMTQWESLCGFTPSDRSRLGYAEVKRASALDELVAKRTHGRGK